MAKKEEWINPRLIDFTLSKWDEEKSTHYICSYNGLYIGCAIKTPDIEYIDIAKAVLGIELTKKMFSSRLSKLKCLIKDEDIIFYISVKRVEVSYSMPR